MKKNNHFIAYMIAIMIMLFSVPVKAQTKTGYAEWDSTSKTLTFSGGESVPEGAYLLNDDYNEPGWLNNSSCEKVVFNDSFKDVRPNSCYHWFYNFTVLQTIEGIENLNTDEVTNMNYMFFGCSSLTSLDLSFFNTANVTNMFGMFQSCSSLTSLDLSSVNTENVMYMTSMFQSCSRLNTIYVSDKFTTEKLIEGPFPGDTNMFSECPLLVGAASYVSGNVGKSMANYNTGYFKTYYKLGNDQVDLFGKSLQTTNSLDLSDDKNFVAHANFKANSVSYNRNLSSSTSKWYTLCLPFAYKPTSFTAYQLKSATDNYVEIEEITGTIAAGTPIIFKFIDGIEGDAKNINISATGAEIENDPGMASTTGIDCQLYGTYKKMIFSSQDYNTFIIYKDKLMNPAQMLNNKTVGLKPFHAYMTMTSQASPKFFSIGSGDEETTAIDLLNSVATDDAEYYDINGRRIDAPVKGVNIVRRGNKTMKLIIK